MDKLKELGKEDKISVYENWIKLGTKKFQSKMSFREFRKLQSIQVSPEQIIHENNENISNNNNENNNEKNNINENDII